MPTFDPESLEAWTGGRWTRRPAAAIGGFSVDTRSLSAGQVFVGLKTDKRDGHDFLEAAAAAGAVAAVVSRPVRGSSLSQLVVADPLAALQAVAGAHRNTFSGSVVGITGSAGKTSTKEILAALLGGDPAGVLATEANLNNQIGVALTLCRIEPSRHHFAVIEAGISAPGEMLRLAAMIRPDVAIVTLVGPAHLADLGDVENVASEKALLAAAVREGGMSIFPRACEGFAAFRQLPPAKRLTIESAQAIGDRPQAKGRVAFTAEHAQGGTKVRVAFGPPPPVSISMARVTDGMAQNVAMAVCAAMRLGIPRRDIERRLSKWNPSPLRGEWRSDDGRRLYLDCYNANPASMADALETFRATAPADEARLFVVGCMEELGSDAPSYHAALGRALSLRGCDMLLAIGAHAADVRRGAIEAGASPAQVETADTVDAVAPRIAAFRGSIFVKGSRRYHLESAFDGAGHREAAHA